MDVVGHVGVVVKVRDILGIKISDEKEQPSPVFCLPKERVGLEYEWEGVRHWTRAMNALAESGTQPPPHATLTSKYYAIHSDHSLRDEGCEWVFRKPYSGTMIISAVEAMDETARIYNFKGSYRTSLHVHLNMQDVDFPHDVTRLGAVYSIVEPFLYDFVGEDRDCCNYCTPWYAHPGHFEAWFNILQDKRLKGLKGPDVIHYSGFFKQGKIHKYSGFNFMSLGDFGTIEFRQAPVTMQKDKVLTWINILMRLKKWVIEHPGITGEQLIVKANTMGPESFLQDVFGSEYKEVVKRTRDINSAFKRGMSTLYHYISLSN